MHTRPGVSLVEVLVSAVLLAIGIGGALSAFVGAARLRAGAAVREASADAAESRLSWFEARGCTLADTLVSGAVGRGLVEEWRVARDSSGVTITGVVRAQWGPGADSVVARSSCP